MSGRARTTWSEQSYRDALQIIAEGLTELVGFGMAIICVRRGDDLVAVALSGAESSAQAGMESGPEELLGARWPVTDLDRLLAVAEDWGRFKLIPHDRASRSNWVWVRESVPVDGEDAWHPNDGAVAPIYDPSGELVGVISVDDPRTGRYPDAAQRRVMDKYAAEAAKVVLAAIEREALERRLQLAQGARQLVRTASRHVSLDRLVEETGPAFLEAFAASALWLRIHGTAETVLARGRHELHGATPTAEMADRISTAAERLWQQQSAAIIYVDGRARNAVQSQAQNDLVRGLVRTAGFDSVLHAPMGAGDECLGSLILGRDPGQADWSEAELEQATEIARDLGRIIRNGQTYVRVQGLVRELRELDAHKSQLIAMVSHELKNPLTVMLANRDLLEPELDGDDRALAHLADIDANAQRMGRVVDNLLLLSKLADPDTPVADGKVDLQPLLREVEGAFTASMAQRGVSLSMTVPDRPLVVRGDATELRTMLANVIGNGIKFSDDGCSVTVTVTAAREEIELVVVDHGIGMSTEDQEKLFSDFFRSDDPAVQARAGCGLGLPIVDRILRRHDGKADVSSELGRGTTFRIVLPTPVGEVGPGPHPDSDAGTASS